MHLLLLTGAKGGSARTTTAVRVCEALVARGIPAGIVDLSPYPTAHMILRDSRVFVLSGRNATTQIAAQSLLKPFEKPNSLVVVDAPRLDDPALLPWLPLVKSMVLTTAINSHAVAAMPALWQSAARLHKLQSGIAFLGLLPVLVREEERAMLAELQKGLPDRMLPVAVPFDLDERRRALAGLIEGDIGIVAPDGPALAAWEALSRHLETRLGLVAEVVVPKAESSAEEAAPKGMLSKLWKLAAKALGPRAAVVGGTR